MLLRRPPFRDLWLSRAVSFTGDGAAAVALTLLAAERHGPGGVSLLLLAFALPRFFGPVAGTIADRTEQRRLMCACELGQALLVGTIALTLPPFPALLVLVAGVGWLATLFAPAGNSAVVTLVPESERLAANALLSLAFNLQVAVGPALGGLLVAGVGTRGALAFDAATFLGSALLLVRVPPIHARPVAGERFRDALRAGLSYARRVSLVRVLALSLFAVVAVAAIDNVALVFLARRTLGSGPSAYGLLVASFGIGMIAASVALAAARTGRSPTTLLVGGYFATGVGSLATGLAPTVPVAALAQAVGGVGNGVELVAAATLIQERVPRPMLGRVFGVMATAANGGQATALVLAAVLLRIASPRLVFVVSGAVVLVITLALMRSLARLREPPLDVPGQDS